jgi:hypothetical protein
MMRGKSNSQACSHGADLLDLNIAPILAEHDE